MSHLQTGDAPCKGAAACPQPDAQGREARSGTCSAWKCPAGGGLAFPLLLQKLLKIDFTQNNKNLRTVTHSGERGSSGQADPAVFLLVSETANVPLRTQHTKCFLEISTRKGKVRKDTSLLPAPPQASAVLGGCASGLSAQGPAPLWRAGAP